MVKIVKRQLTVLSKVKREYNPFTRTYDRTYAMTTKEITKVIAEQKKPYLISSRAIISGDIIELLHYEKAYMKNGTSKAPCKGKQKITVEEKKRADNIQRAKQKLRRLINANAHNNDSFITLTYKECNKDVKKGKDDFKKFIKRLEYYRKQVLGDKWSKLKYVYVVEFQDKYGRGAVHFHCIFFGIEYIPHKEIDRLWGLGFVKINNIKRVDNIGAYVVKYMNKSLEDDRLNNNDLYGRSRQNLKEPKIIEKKEVVSLLKNVYMDKVVYESEFQTDYKGIVTYTQINLKRKKLSTISENTGT